MHVVIAEDDRFQAQALEKHLKKRYDCQVTTVATEQDFLARIPTWQQDPPSAFIIDMMMPWTTLGGPPQPPDYETHERAGLRCLRLLENSPYLQPVPAVIYTILDDLDLEGQTATFPAHYRFLSKTLTFEPLMHTLGDLL